MDKYTVIFVKRIVLIFMIGLLGACVSYKLKPVGANNAGEIKFNTVNVWNKTPTNLGPKTEVWTADGVLLNQLVFVSGISAGQGMFRDFSKDTPMPKFNPKVLPHELKALVETSLTNTSGGKYPITTNNLKPRKVADSMGVEFDLEFYNADGLMNKGRALVLVKNDKLYSVIFSASAVYHFDRYSQEFDSILASLKI
jgi:hypothetical protein